MRRAVSIFLLAGGAAGAGRDLPHLAPESQKPLFVVVAALTEPQEIPLLISPVDFRLREFAAPAAAPAWTEELYGQIRARLAEFQ